LDKSGSVGNIVDGWKNQIAFTADLIEGLSDGSRVATMTFSNSPQVWHELGVKDPKTVAGEVRENVSREMDGKTNTGQALKKAIKEFGDNNTNHKKIVLVTDGAPSDNPCKVKQELIDDGIKLIILVVGSDKFTEKEAAKLECFENNGDNSVVGKSKNFEEMKEHLEEVTRAVCDTPDVPVLTPVIPEPHPIPEPDCYPTACLNRCDAKYSSGDAYYCKKGCASMGGGKVVTANRFCKLKGTMSDKELYNHCLMRCSKASDQLPRQGMCRYGCENWAPANAVI